MQISGYRIDTEEFINGCDKPNRRSILWVSFHRLEERAKFEKSGTHRLPLICCTVYSLLSVCS
jgi:hypothetical protein